MAMKSPLLLQALFLYNVDQPASATYTVMQQRIQQIIDIPKKK